MTVLLIGSISRDLLPGGRSAPGGVPYWAGLALLRLGARVRVVTRVADRDAALLDPLRRAGAEVRPRPSRATTCCRNEYGPGGDRHELWSCSDPIRSEDVPADWRAADAVQLGPLHRRDLAPGIARALRGRIALDAQGLVRTGRRARTHLAPARGLRARLDGVEILKVSESEMPFVLGPGEDPRAWMARHGIRELIVTRAARGATLVTAEATVELPAVAAVPRYPVGAGDVFLAAYLFARARGRGAARAARFASRASAAKIESGELPAGFALEEDGT